MRYAAPIVACAACAWIILIVAAPLVPPPLAAFLYLTGSFICHQRPDRTFHLEGGQLPVCARCAGIYAGAALGLVVAVLGHQGVVRARPARGRVLPHRPAVVMLAAAVPTFLTLAAEWTGVWNPGNAVRAFAGVVVGAAVAAVVVTLHYGECASRRPIASSRPPTPI